MIQDVMDTAGEGRAGIENDTAADLEVVHVAALVSENTAEVQFAVTHVDPAHFLNHEVEDTHETDIMIEETEIVTESDTTTLEVIEVIEVIEEIEEIVEIVEIVEIEQIEEIVTDIDCHLSTEGHIFSRLFSSFSRSG